MHIEQTALKRPDRSNSVTDCSLLKYAISFRKIIDIYDQ